MFQGELIRENSAALGRVIQLHAALQGKCLQVVAAVPSLIPHVGAAVKKDPVIWTSSQSTCETCHMNREMYIVSTLHVSLDTWMTAAVPLNLTMFTNSF